VTADHRKK